MFNFFNINFGLRRENTFNCKRFENMPMFVFSMNIYGAYSCEVSQIMDISDYRY